MADVEDAEYQMLLQYGRDGRLVCDSAAFIEWDRYTINLCPLLALSRLIKHVCL